MRILIRNATIVPMTVENLSFLGSIAIDGRKLVAIGDEPVNFHADKIIDAQNMIALPGLVNAHTHLSMTYFRNYRDSVADLHQWLEEVWKLEDKLVAEDTYIASLLGLAEMILSGTTCFADMYFFPEGTAQAIKDAKMKANLGLTLFGDETDSKQRIAERLPFLQSLKQESDGKIDFSIAPHAVYTCSPQTFRLAADTAQREGCRVHTHASETRKEVQDCIATYHISPIEHVHTHGVLKAGCILAHGVHPSEEDIELLASGNVSVIHNPSSNCKLGSGIAPIASYKAAGVRLALGTDGASSNNNLDMFKEIRLAAMLSSAVTGNPLSLSPFDILRMATIGGAEALGREQECGTLEVGKDADLIWINTTGAHVTPLNNIFSALVYAIQSSDVDTVLCAGQILMENRVLQTIDYERTRKLFMQSWHAIQER